MSGLYIRFELAPETLVDRGLWRYLPVINVDRVSEIPSNYPGAMGVPITFMGKHDPEQFEVVDLTNHVRLEDGREPYRRVVVRNLHPALPERMSLTISEAAG